MTDILYQSLARHFYRAKVVPGAHDRIDGLDHIDKVIDIDQSPIGRTPRSNPATYTGLFTFIRELFAMLPDAKARASTTCGTCMSRSRSDYSLPSQACRAVGNRP